MGSLHFMSDSHCMAPGWRSGSRGTRAVRRDFEGFLSNNKLKLFSLGVSSTGNHKCTVTLTRRSSSRTSAPGFATSQVFVFDRPPLRVTVTHPAAPGHSTGTGTMCECSIRIPFISSRRIFQSGVESEVLHSEAALCVTINPPQTSSHLLQATAGQTQEVVCVCTRARARVCTSSVQEG